MGRAVHNDVLDAAFDIVKLADKMSACSAEPTSVAQATSSTGTNLMIAIKTGMTTGTTYFAAPSDRTGGGREITVKSVSVASISKTGTNTANHVALVDSGTTPDRLLYVTTCTSQPLVGGNSMTFQSWKIGIADPAAP